MQNLISPRSYCYELPILATPGAGSQLYFPDDANVRNVLLLGISVFSSTQMAYSPQLRPVINGSDVPNFSFTLKDGNSNELYKDCPGYDYVPSYNGGFVRLVNALRVTWTSSYVTILNAGAFSANQSFIFQLYYQTI